LKLEGDKRMNSNSRNRWASWAWPLASCAWLACSVTPIETAETGDAAVGGDQGAGGAAGANSKCSWGGYGGSDPTVKALSCDSAKWAIFGVHGEIQGSAILITVPWCGTCSQQICSLTGAVTDATITADGVWATVTDGASSGCMTVLLQPEDGMTEGDITFTASISGLDQCHEPLTCPIANGYHVSVGGDGTVTVQAK
jgi:hypothetical protein